MSTQDDRRQQARTDTAKAYMDTERKKGNDVSFEKCYRHVSERADKIDAKRDRNIKEA